MIICILYAPTSVLIRWKEILFKIFSLNLVVRNFQSWLTPSIGDDEAAAGFLHPHDRHHSERAVPPHTPFCHHPTNPCHTASPLSISWYPQNTQRWTFVFIVGSQATFEHQKPLGKCWSISREKGFRTRFSSKAVPTHWDRTFRKC